MVKMVIRHDDFDWRMPTEHYIKIHEKFLEKNLIETAVMQLTIEGRIPNYQEDLINYIKETPNWDIQLHGWAHSHYGEMSYDEIVKDLCAAKYMIWEMFGVKPTIWHTPWNEDSPDMQEAMKFVGMKINNESYDIKKFIRENNEGIYEGNSFYFHGWNQKECSYLDEALSIAETL